MVFNSSNAHFNPRSREGSDDFFICFISHGLYFNPRSREGSDGHGCFRFNLRVISIHAPAKGATSFCSLTVFNVCISIHAPAKGATCRKNKNNYRNYYFNPRSREGSDDDAPEDTPEVEISIHAPAKGATLYIPMDVGAINISIHAPAKGATAILYSKFHFLCIILYILSAIT